MEVLIGFSFIVFFLNLLKISKKYILKKYMRRTKEKLFWMHAVTDKSQNSWIVVCFFFSIASHIHKCSQKNNPLELTDQINLCMIQRVFFRYV